MSIIHIKNWGMQSNEVQKLQDSYLLEMFKDI